MTDSCRAACCRSSESSRSRKSANGSIVAEGSCAASDPASSTAIANELARRMPIPVESVRLSITIEPGISNWQRMTRRRWQSLSVGGDGPGCFAIKPRMDQKSRPGHATRGGEELRYTNSVQKMDLDEVDANNGGSVDTCAGATAWSGADTLFDKLVTPEGKTEGRA